MHKKEQKYHLRGKCIVCWETSKQTSGLQRVLHPRCVDELAVNPAPGALPNYMYIVWSKVYRIIGYIAEDLDCIYRREIEQLKGLIRAQLGICWLQSSPRAPPTPPLRQTISLWMPHQNSCRPYLFLCFVHGLSEGARVALSILEFNCGVQHLFNLSNNLPRNEWSKRSCHKPM